MSVLRPHRAISCGVLVPPSSLLQMIEYCRLVCPGVAAGVASCHATSGVSEYALSSGPPNSARLRPYSTGVYRAVRYPASWAAYVTKWKPDNTARCTPAAERSPRSEEHT